MINDDIKDINDGCKRAVSYIKQRGRIAPIDLPSRIYFNAYTLPHLKEIVEGFRESTASINQSVNLLQGDSLKLLEKAAKQADENAKRTNANIKGASKEQNDKLEKMMKQQKAIADQQTKAMEALVANLIAEHKKDRQARQKETEKSVQAVTLLEQKFGTKGLENAALAADGKKYAEQMVDELVNNGIDKKEATKRVNAALASVRIEKQNHKAPLKKARTIEAQKGADPPVAKNSTSTKGVAPPPKNNNTVPPKADTPKTVKDSKVSTQDVAIMCIDSDNGGKSMSHFQNHPILYLHIYQLVLLLPKRTLSFCESLL